ncbi:MAG: TetR/AcrR family transcriptional regulator [Alphaproteobacteria bacterium]
MSKSPPSSSSSSGGNGDKSGDDAKRARSERTANRFDARRLEILRTAARMFSEKGYHQCSLTDVADALNLTKPALYYYAKSKDELLFECGRIALGNLADAVNDAKTRDLTGREQLDIFFQNYAEMICDDFGRCLVVTEPRDLGPEGRTTNVKGRRDIEAEVRSMFERGIKDGSIRKCDVKLTTSMLFGAFNSVAGWYREDGRLTPKTIAARFMDVVDGGLIPPSTT